MSRFPKEYWLEFIERTIRAALIVFLTAIFINSWSDASLSWAQKLAAAGLGALLSMGLSLLSALKDSRSTWFFADKQPGEQTQIPQTPASP